MTPRFETGRRIVAIDPAGAGVTVRDDEGNSWQASHVVVAAGSWTDEIRLPETPASAVRPVRGQLIRLTWNAPPLSHVIWGKDCYVVPWQDGTVLVGATVEEVGFDERTTAAGVRDLLEAVCELLPEAWGATFVDARAGLRPASADGLPVVGRSSTVPGLVYATGHFRNGILLAPLTASLVADLILENRDEDPALALMSPARPGTDAETLRPLLTEPGRGLLHGLERDYRQLILEQAPAARRCARSPGRAAPG